ncbi:MAG: aminoglycoside phosphotransferase family protein [Gammaproteobacteria bacterium]|nr:aminoglycoside phosphotransferase family protein [Gammaproteobacteria bacterium]
MNFNEPPFNVTSDRALPTAVLALDFSYMTDQLKNLSTVCQPHESLKIKSIEVIRHKPGKRCLIEYVCELKSTNTLRLLILLGKIRTNHSGKKDYRFQKLLWKNGFSTQNFDSVSVAMPIGRIKELNMWLQEKLAGENLTDLLSMPGSLKLMPTIAHAARKIHLSKIFVQRKHTLNDELDILEGCFQMVSASHPSLEKKLHDLLIKARFISQDLHKRELQPIHRDFYSDQIIVSPLSEKIHIVDFDLFCMGDPAVDIGNFLGHLTEYSLREYGDAQVLNQHEEIILESFIDLAGNSERNPVKVYTLLTLMRHIYLSTLFVKRKDFMIDILNLCEQKIADYY